MEESTEKYPFILGFTFIRYDIRDELELSNHEYAIAHALAFVGKKNILMTEGNENVHLHRTNYNPSAKELAKDLGFCKKTIYNSLSELREKGLIESDCLESTNLWVIKEQSKKPKRFLYDIVQHGHRKQLEINFTQYLVCAIYDRLSSNREWITFDKKEIAKTVGISVMQLHRIIKQMTIKNLMETQLRKMSNGKDFLDVKMTNQWNSPKSV